jgi:hypothetical protein
MFIFRSLQGALSESPASQSLLELDGGVKVLIGLGWDESFDPARLQELEKYVVPQYGSFLYFPFATTCTRRILDLTFLPRYSLK